MADYQWTGPLSPDSAALFSLFTNLYDDVPTQESDTDISNLHYSEQTDFDASLQVDVNQQTPRTANHSGLDQRKRAGVSRNNYLNLPGYSCFSVATGERAHAPKRSAFSQERRKEVKQLRRLGACLRCKFRKISCSGGDPCEPCRAIAQAKIGSRVLMWMECIRPSFEAVTIFSKVDFRDQRSSLDEIKGNILGHNDASVVSAPFELTLESTTNRLIQWISEGSNHSYFSIVGLLRSNNLSKILTLALGSNLSENFRLLVYLTNDVTTRAVGDAHYGYNAETLHMVSHYAGNMVLNAVQSRLRPIALEESRTMHDDLRAVFLVLFESLTCTEITQALLRGQPVKSGFKKRVEGFIRLVNHYLVYIIGLLVDIDTDSYSSLLATCKFQWDNPGSSVKSLTSDHSDKASEIFDSKPEEEYIGGLESTGIQPLATCDTCGNFGSTLDHTGRCQKCHLDFDVSARGTMLDGYIDQRAPEKLGDRDHANATTLPYDGGHQNLSYHTMHHSSSLQHVNSRTMDRYYPEGGNSRMCSAYITSASPRRRHLQPDESVTKIRCSPQKYGRRYGQEAMQRISVQVPQHEGESPTYWIFFNQNEQFEIHSNFNKRAFINSPKRIYPTEFVERGDPTERPTPSFDQSNGVGASGLERIAGSQTRTSSSYTTSPTSARTIFTSSSYVSSFQSVSGLGKVKCLWCEKTASIFNNDELCDECNKLLNPQSFESERLEVPIDFKETGLEP